LDPPLLPFRFSYRHLSTSKYVSFLQKLHLLVEVCSSCCLFSAVEFSIIHLFQHSSVLPSVHLSFRLVANCQQKVLRAARPDAKKVVFLITDGYSNSGDPRPVARRLRQDSVDVFTFGIRDGNFVELCDMASDDKHEHVYILNSFQEFEALARRALHEGMLNFVSFRKVLCSP